MTAQSKRGLDSSSSLVIDETCPRQRRSQCDTVCSFYFFHSFFFLLFFLHLVAAKPPQSVSLTLDPSRLQALVDPSSLLQQSPPYPGLLARQSKVPETLVCPEFPPLPP